MRTLIMAGAIGLALAVAGCSKTDQQTTQADANATAQDVKTSSQQAGNEVKADATKLGQDIKTSAEKSGHDLKAIAKDPEVKKAAGDLKASLKELGTSVKDASKKHKDGSDTSDAAKNGQ
ncbi:MAG: hypothetical protein KGO51_06065 [Alphaproteobacteria bacterium]|nr:hypothetical protein [Alphaproteobacteria bacterium]